MSEEFFLIIGVLVVILILGLFSRNFKAFFSEKGLKIDKSQESDNIKISSVTENSKVDITSKSGQNIEVNKVEGSDVTVR